MFFGKRKYQRGRSVQKALSALEFCLETGCSLSIIILFLPYNHRTTDIITPFLVKKMEPGGSVVTNS